MASAMPLQNGLAIFRWMLVMDRCRGMLDCVRVLLIDTCGEVGSVALAEDDRVVVSESLPAREASAELLPAVERLLLTQGWGLRELDGVGVVSGPGSFTGVRVGMAAAKGLCEAAGLPLAAVSRLEVLAGAAGLQAGVAALDAGRGGFYVRAVMLDGGAREMLVEKDALREMIGVNGRVIVTEQRAMDALAELRPEMRVIAIGIGDALPAALRELRAGCDDAALVDANYVRGEHDIYAKRRGDGA
jgi:tRNA threonylcarbamoyladenosine biosynthesis protein TsaB